MIQFEGVNKWYGDYHALQAIANAIQPSRANIADPRPPIGVFLMVGPSGVGKTETALALAPTRSHPPASRAGVRLTAATLRCPMLSVPRNMERGSYSSAPVRQRRSGKTAALFAKPAAPTAN